MTTQFFKTYFLLLLTNFYNCLPLQTQQQYSYSEPSQNQWIAAQHCFLEDKPTDNYFAIYKRCTRGEQIIDNLRQRIANDYFRPINLDNSFDINKTRNIEPAIIKSSVGTSVFCAIPKSGSTAWKRVLERVQGASSNIYLSPGGNIHFRPVTKLGDISKEKQVQITQSNDIPRWIVVRNPYARLFSAYREKLLEGYMPTRIKFHKKFDLDFTNQVSVSFAEFVKALYDMYHSSTTKDGKPKRMHSLSVLNAVDPHFAWQTTFCGQQQGFGFDYVLKSELISEWYPQIIETLNYTDFVMSGWPGEDQCFLSVPTQTCNGPSLQQPHVPTSFTQNYDKNTTQQKNKKISATLHSRGSNALLFEAYDEEIARMATEIYWQDLVALQYPIWDGSPESFRIV
eukprot:TRINITY_DN5087_c0_g1_i3.p1 TRINITY_DN5087_c0_g1~~TRINITY_DN5087_c0_g1_i3.p1  ORF type:complete len:431 (-),score=4.92 TRINITY_DN5087_c0_g1_i3:316-1506(-)